MDTRLDDSPWRRIHTTIALALGIGWMLDAFEVQIIDADRPVTFSYTAAAVSMLGFGAAAATGSPVVVLAGLALPGGFWLIGAVAGAIWWRRGAESTGVSLESLARVR